MLRGAHGPRYRNFYYGNFKSFTQARSGRGARAAPLDDDAATSAERGHRHRYTSQEDSHLALQEVPAFWAFALEPHFRAADLFDALEAGPRMVTRCDRPDLVEDLEAHVALTFLRRSSRAHRRSHGGLSCSGSNLRGWRCRSRRDRRGLRCGAGSGGGGCSGPGGGLRWLRPARLLVHVCWLYVCCLPLLARTG